MHKARSPANRRPGSDAGRAPKSSAHGQGNFAALPWCHPVRYHGWSGQAPLGRVLGRPARVGEIRLRRSDRPGDRPAGSVAGPAPMRASGPADGTRAAPRPRKRDGGHRPRLMPLADATAISFVSPLLLVALSVPLLGERVSVHGWVGVACGFAGILIVIRPGAGTIAWAALFPLATAFVFALYQALTRLVSRGDDPVVTLAWTIAVGLALVTPLLLPSWHPVARADWPLLGLLRPALRRRAVPADSRLRDRPGRGAGAVHLHPDRRGGGVRRAGVRGRAGPLDHGRHGSRHSGRHLRSSPSGAMKVRRRRQSIRPCQKRRKRLAPAPVRPPPG